MAHNCNMAITCLNSWRKKGALTLMVILFWVGLLSAQSTETNNSAEKLNQFELASQAEADVLMNAHTVKIPLSPGTHCIITGNETECLYFDTITVKDAAVLIFSDDIQLIEYNMTGANDEKEIERSLVAGGSGNPGQEEGPVQKLHSPAAVYCGGNNSFEVIDDPTLLQINDGNELKVFIPNAFSPDGNGLNDYFSISGDNIQSYQMNIFDRNGKLIFSNDGGETGWDGRLENGRVPDRSGVYIYSIHVTDLKGKIFTYKGHVMLIR